MSDAPRAPTSGARGALRARPAFWWLFALSLVIVCAPFVAVTAPPLLDYPNHLARAYILADGEQARLLGSYYQPHWAILPNLAFDALAVELARFVPIERVGQICTVLAAALLGSGVVAVSAAAHGRARPFCLLGMLFVFSEPFAWGFINLILGFGLALWGVAFWLSTRGGSLAKRLYWSLPFSIVLFFAHLFAFAAWGVAVAGIEIVAAWRATAPMLVLRRAAMAAAALLIGPLLLLASSPTPLTPGTTHFGPLLGRLRNLPLAPLRNFNDALDILTVLGLALAIGLGFWTRRLTLAPSLRAALLLLAVLCPLIPHTLATSSNAELRLPVFAALLFAAACDWRFATLAEARAAALAFLLLLGIRTAVTLQAFEAGSAFTAALRAAVATLPAGVRIASVTVTNPANHRMRPEWEHAICYAVIDRGDFVPSIFANPEQQPILLAPPLRRLRFPPSHVVSREGVALLASADLDNLDALVVVNPKALLGGLPDRLIPRLRGQDFVLYVVAHGDADARGHTAEPYGAVLLDHTAR